MLTLQWVTGWWLAGTVTVLFWEYSHLTRAEEVSWNCTLESWNTEKIRIIILSISMAKESKV